MNQTYRLLALCARVEGHPIFYEQLKKQVRQFTAWHELPAQAEIHGMGPLLWHHLRQAEIGIPIETERTLRGIFLRERSLNRAHTLTLVETQKLLREAGILALVLKGLALAYQYYPDPALRPVSDIDLLLNKEDVLPAMNVLAEAGYQVNFPDPALPILPSELTANSPTHNGISTHIELHHYDSSHRVPNDFFHDNEFKSFNEPVQELLIEDCIIYTPSFMDTLQYLMRHMSRHLFFAVTDKPLPLKWSTDILALVERHAEEIDWAVIQHNDPAFIHRLTVLYSLTPIPEKYKALIPIQKNAAPSGVNQYPKGWPQQAFSKKRVSLWRFIRLSIQVPSAWWVRLYYGVSEGPGIFWYGRVIYRLRVLRLMLKAALRRLSL